MTMRGAYKAPAPARPFSYKVKGGRKVTDAYDACHRAWRVGLLGSWYFGRRSPNDPTLVWELDDVEIGEHAAPDTVGIVGRMVAARVEAAGIGSISWGETWCGYRGVIVNYADGSRAVEAFDGRGVCIVETSADGATVAA